MGFSYACDVMETVEFEKSGTFRDCLWTVVAEDKLALITDANLGRNLEISITHLLPVVFYLTNCFRSLNSLADLSGKSKE